MTSSDEVFKVFDTAERFAACVLRETARVPLFARSGSLPPQINGVNTDVFFETSIGECIKDAKKNAASFCLNLKDSDETREEGFYIKNVLKSAGFAAQKVGPLLYVSSSGLAPSTVIELDISYNPFGGFEPTNVPVIIKSTAPRTVYDTPSVSINPPNTPQVLFANKLGITVEIEDPMHEVFVSTMLNIDYDGGFMPFVNKFYGYFLCPDTKAPNKYTHNIMSAKSAFNLYDLLKSDTSISYRNIIGTDITLHRNLMLNIFAQYLYTIDYLKEKWNMRHFDTHLKNIMFNYVHDRVFKVPENRPEKMDYQGKNMANVNWMVIQAGNRRLWVENTGLVMKLIDFGQTSFMVNGVEFTNKEIDMFHHGEEALLLTNESESAYNSMEVNMFLVNLFKSYVENSWEVSDPTKNMPIIDFFQTILDGDIDWANNGEILDNILSGLVVLTPEDVNGQTLYIDETNKVVSPRKYFTNRSLLYPDFTSQKMERLPTGDYKVVNWFANRRDMVDVSNFTLFDTWWDKFFGYLEEIGFMVDDNNFFISMKGNAPDITNITPDKIIYLDKEQNGSRFSAGLRAYNQAWSDWNKTCVEAPSSNMDELIRSFAPYESQEILSGSPSKSEKCIRMKNLYVDKNDPRSLFPRKDFGEDISFDSPYYDPSATTFSPAMKRFFDTNPPDFSINNDSIQYWMVAVNPANIGLGSISPDTSLNFTSYSYQRWVNYKTPKNTGDYINTVRMHIVKVNPTLTDNSAVISKTLWTTASETPSDGYFTNGGYFVVGTNTTDPLAVTTTGRRVAEDRIFTPIGFYYTREKGAETYIDIPEGYKKFFYAVVMLENEVMLVPYEEFLASHRTEERNQVYQLKNTTITPVDDGEDYIERFLRANPGVVFQEKTQVISTTDDKGVNRPVLVDGTIANYKAVFVTGPVLIKEGRVVFTQEVLAASRFIDRTGSPYKVSFHSKSDSMFFAEEGERNFPYGQRHSNFYITHNVMGLTDDNEVVFFLFEGRGFNAPGVDRAQLAAMVSNFGVKTLVSLDGGFSAQGILRYNNTSKLLLSDPDKRRVGIVMRFLSFDRDLSSSISSDFEKDSSTEDFDNKSP